MNSKSLVFIAFAVWCAICWRWYVCTIKGVCTDTATAMVSNGQDAGIEPAGNTTRQNADIQPVENATGSNTNSSQASPTQAISPSRIDEVQIEQVEDRMIVHFPYNSIRKEDDAAIDGYLNRLAAELIASGSTATITGHTDFVGESQYNIQFGLERAASIRNILIKKGVPKSQIKIKSYGESRAVGTNDTPWGRYLNRRVEIRIK